MGGVVVSSATGVSSSGIILVSSVIGVKVSSKGTDISSLTGAMVSSTGVSFLKVTSFVCFFLKQISKEIE
ncbi:hypothetical protein BOQ60_04625 [Chryseobacterium sp. CH1]|nr:hypothetical protein BOQ60_04625 [Chryseobacterium sp. CH1]